MNKHLISFAKSKAVPMYREAADKLNIDLKNMTKSLQTELLNIGKKVRDTISQDMDRMITGDEFATDNFEVPDSDDSYLQLKKAISKDIQMLELTWAADLKDPAAQLKATNPFQETCLLNSEGHSRDVDSEDDDSEDGNSLHDGFAGSNSAGEDSAHDSDSDSVSESLDLGEDSSNEDESEREH